jgi:hypothetical protein
VLKLQLRDIGTTLSDGSQRAAITPNAEERYGWRDSSLELERGLDVVELSVDVLLCDLESPVIPPPPAVSKRPS